MKLKPVIDEWLEYAEKDLKVAGLFNRNHPKLQH